MSNKIVLTTIYRTRRFSSMNHLTFTSRGEAEALKGESEDDDDKHDEHDEHDEHEEGGFEDLEDTEDEELLNFYEEEYGRRSAATPPNQGQGKSPSSFFRNEEAFDDIKASQADYLLEAPTIPPLFGRAKSENSNKGGGGGIGGSPGMSGGGGGRGISSIDESKDSTLSQSMNIKNKIGGGEGREGGGGEGDSEIDCGSDGGPGGWGFAAGLHKVHKNVINVQKSAKGVVKGMRRRSSTTG